ncbi:MAG TPA: aminodeoxychorismate synthase component I [Rhizomicrobium sp.]|nr:aminodeoxychorismate synthase component I [Rhizomicrobium sp.]
MLVILDDTVGARRVAFSGALEIISASTPAEVPAALKAIQRALAAGRYVAGWLGYELGHALESRLAGLTAAPATPSAMPLMKLGVFQGPGEAPPAQGRAYAGPLAPEWDMAAYVRRFAAVKDYIAAGDIYQANLSFRARFAFAGTPRALYEHLLARSAAAHCAFVDDGERQIVSLSPELFFDLATDGTLTSRPMKGTWPRGDGDDAMERAALGTSEKDRAENLMIVDLIRNDLSRIGEVGSVAVPELFRVETYPTLHTMVSTVTARKRADADVTDILKALFPCGSVTGAPKIRAMEILHELETSPRGVYCGAVGFFTPPDGGKGIGARFNVAIRTLTIHGGQGELGIGGGVVQDSGAESEYAECLLKARFFESARRPLELIETLKWHDGFVREGRHLARMAASARVFGMAFDEPLARAALDAAVAGGVGPLRVRLVLDETGLHRATAHALPPNPPRWTYALSPERTFSGDVLLRHKTGWRELYEGEVARLGGDEAVFCNERGELTEGARSNIFIRRDGLLLTPPLSSGLLDGCLRAELLAEGKAREAVLMPGDLENGEVWFGNSLRGLIRGIAL